MKPTFSTFSPTLMPNHARQASQVLRRGLFEDEQWLGVNKRRQLQIPPERLLDILDTGSLTHRLKRASNGEFKVNVVKQGWQRPSFNERRRLKLKDREFALIREVELVCQGVIWVIARSVIPRNTLQGKFKHLKSLGHRPLGASLFREPSLERTFFELSQLHASHLPSFTNQLEGQSAWGRRSIFTLQGKQEVLVAEIFMHACPFLNAYA